MLDYLSSNSPSKTFLNKKHNHSHMNSNDSKSSSKDLFGLLKKLNHTTSAYSNDLPPKLEFKYSHTLNSTDTKPKSTETIPTDDHHRLPPSHTKKEPNPFNSFYKGSAMIGGGLNNMGNTCFLNSVLQCLMYTQPIQSYLLNSEHKSKCKAASVCFLCELALIIKSLQERKAVAPYGVIRNVKLISKHIRIGRQEDAHEFFIFFLDALEKAYNGFQKLTSNKFIVNSKGNSLQDLRNANLIQNVFGGELISEVVCLKCRHTSATADKMLTLSLELNNSDSIERCIENFCKSELLFGSNKVLCDTCKVKNDSKKRFTFKALPNVLVIHLKRFDNYQRKIQKFIRYSVELDMQRYIGDNLALTESCTKYTLYAILIHSGYSADSGHYYSFLRRNGAWYEMNDSFVQKVGESYAMKQAPYMIFYQKTQIEPVEVVKAAPARARQMKVHWQFDNVKVEDIPVVFSNRRKKKAVKLGKINHLKKMKMEMENGRSEDKGEGNDMSISEHEDGEDTYALMMKNFGENLHKIDHQYRNTENDDDEEEEDHRLNHLKRNGKAKSDSKLMIKSANLRSLYNSKKISLWDEDMDDNAQTSKEPSKVSEQIKFLSEAKSLFTPNKIKTKTEYDIKLDKGKAKKVYVNSKHFQKKNYFQSISNKNLLP